MSKKRKIIIMLGVLTIGIFVSVLIIGAVAYRLYSRKADDSELAFAPTEVGTPVGDRVTKNIGPAGGTLASPDGRLTLTVPQNALTETIAFSIQPITNKADGGLGLAYRLEPDGKTFASPLQISIRYEEKDLEGTIPEALSLAYQDTDGGWHLQDGAILDQNAKLLTFNTTHFTDWSFLSRLRISPEKATVRVGETVQLKFVRCNYLQNGMLDRLRRWAQGSGKPCEVTNGKYYWHISANWFADIGTIDEPHELSVIYTAPSKKPSPNIATVSFPYELTSYGDVYAPPNRGMFISRITIIDWGYKASGESHDEVYSGVICDLAKEFTVNGTGLANFAFKFVPSSDAKKRTVSYTSSYSPGGAAVTESGSGSYDVIGMETDKPRIVLTIDKATATATVMGHSVPVQPSQAGTVSINLTPAGPDECNKK